MIKNDNNLTPSQIGYFKQTSKSNIKNNTVNSLIEVGYFLTNLKQIVKGIKIYKLLKW